MNRVSKRLSAAISTIKCPGCSQRVLPTTLGAASPTPAPTPPSAEDTGGRRWSFIWVPPRGEFCPECGFPLSRYVARLKWVRLFSAGVVLLAIALSFFVLSQITNLGEALTWPLRIAAGAGLVTFLVGLGGIIIGGPRGPMEGDSASGGTGTTES